MPFTKRRTLLEIQRFIRKRLPVKLCRDLKYLRIVKEADVECAAYTIYVILSVKVADGVY